MCGTLLWRQPSFSQSSIEQESIPQQRSRLTSVLVQYRYHPYAAVGDFLNEGLCLQRKFTVLEYHETIHQEHSCIHCCYDTLDQSLFHYSVILSPHRFY